jgi:hypothetical protein
VARAERVQDSRSELARAIKTERTKLIVYQRLRRFSCLHGNIKRFLAGDSFGEAKAAFDEFQELSRPLRLTSHFNKARGAYRNLLQRRFPEILAISDHGFSLAKVPEMAPLLVVFDVAAAFCDFFFPYLIERFLPPLAGGRVGLVVYNWTYSLGEGGESGISGCLLLFRSILSALGLAGIEFPPANQEQYVRVALWLASGPSHDLEAAADELCDLAGMERSSVAVLIDDAILASLLGDCRDMLKKGQPFLEVVRAARSRVDKDQFPRTLKQLTILATVVWKDEKDKIRSAVPMLFALEPAAVAFECGLFMERAILAD